MLRCGIASGLAACSSDGFPWPLQRLSPCTGLRLGAVVGGSFSAFFLIAVNFGWLLLSLKRMESYLGAAPPYFCLAAEGAVVQKTPLGSLCGAQSSPKSRWKPLIVFHSGNMRAPGSEFWRILGCTLLKEAAAQKSHGDSSGLV